MQKVGFKSPVLITIDQKNIKPMTRLIQQSCNFVESYFVWHGKVYRTSLEQKLDGKKIATLTSKDYRQTALEIVVKITTYLTLVIPIIIIFAKLIYRHIQKYTLSELVVSRENLSKRAIPVPIPNPRQDTDILILPTFALSLGLEEEYVNGIESLCQQNSETPDSFKIRLYLKAIIEHFDKTDVGEELKKEILINIARDCSSEVCENGKLKKIRKCYHRLFGINSNETEQVILSEIEDLKLECVNQIANDVMNKNDFAFHPEFINAFQTHLGLELGLDYDEGIQDQVASWPVVANYFCGSNLEKIKKRFLKMYNTDLIVDMIFNKLNGATDAYGVALHLTDYHQTLFNYLSKYGFEKPKTIEKLKNGPLKEYVNKIEKETATHNKNIDVMHTSALNEYISDHYFYFDEEMYTTTQLKKEGVTMLLKIIGILE